jgi:hypothetical protein
MAVDASIALRTPQVQQTNPFETVNQMMSLQAAMARNQQTQAEMQQYKQDQAENQAIGEALKRNVKQNEDGSTGVDYTRALGDIYKIAPQKAMVIEEQMRKSANNSEEQKIKTQQLGLDAKKVDLEGTKTALDFSKLDLDTKKLLLEKAKFENDAIGKIAGGVNDQASYESALLRGKALGLNVDHLPKQYDPKVIDGIIKQTLTAKDQLDQKNKEVDQAELERHHKAGEAIQGGNTANAETYRSFTVADKINNDIQQLSKTHLQSRDSYKRIINSYKNPDSAGDQALIYNYAKMLDNVGAVRDMDYATIAGMGNIFDNAGAIIKRIQSGERLTESVRDQIFNRAQRLYEGSRSSYLETKKTVDQNVQYWKSKGLLDKEWNSYDPDPGVDPTNPNTYNSNPAGPGGKARPGLPPPRPPTPMPYSPGKMDLTDDGKGGFIYDDGEQ